MQSLSSYIWLTAGLLVSVAIAATYFTQRSRKEPAGAELPPYFGKAPLTPAERELYARLREAVPECVVLAQVALSSLVGVREQGNWRQWFNRISQKSVDFVLCLPHDFTVVAVIELDDRTHGRSDRQRADAAKDDALKVAGHPVLRFKCSDVPSVEKIRTIIAGAPTMLTGA